MNRAPVLLSLSLSLSILPATLAGAQASPARVERTAAHRHVATLPFQVQIVATALPEGDSSIQSDDNSWNARGYDLRTLIAQIFDIDVRRVDFPDQSIAGQRYDIHVDLATATDDDTIKQALAVAVEKRFGIQITRENREMNVYVLTAPEGPHSALRHTDPKAEAEGGSITFFGRNCSESGSQTGIAVADSTIADFRRTLEPQLDRVLVDETHLSGNYDFTVSSYANQQELFQHLHDQLGLVVAEGQRKVTVLAVQRQANDSQSLQARL